MAQGVDILVFELDGERHGLLAGDVREVLRACSLAPLPDAPAFEGALNLRGQAVPVLDLRRRLGRPPRPIDPHDHLVVVAAGQRLLALRVDRAAELRRLPAADLEGVAELAPSAPAGAWVARLADGLLPVHDARALLSGEVSR